MKILNLFCGIGGNRTLWGNEHQITAVDNNQQIAWIYTKRFPKDKVIIADAYEFMVNHYNEYDLIAVFPPCITHTRMVAFPRFKKKLPDLRLYSIIIFLQRFFKGYWFVENVIPHYHPLIKPSAIIDRHYIWCNFPLKNKRWPKPEGNFKDLPLNVLCDWLKVDINLISLLPAHNERNHDNKRNSLRNCMLPEAGKYILDSIPNKKIQKTLQKYS